jgi:hypothetical protein
MDEIIDYTIKEKFIILGQGLQYSVDLFYHWIDIMSEPYDRIYNDCFFYELNGSYFYNSIAGHTFKLGPDRYK